MIMKTIKKMQKHTYWKTKQKRNNIVFKIKRLYYTIKEKLSEKNKEALSFWTVFKKIIPSVLFSAIIVFAVYFLDRFIGNKKILEFNVTKDLQVLIDVSIAFIGFNGVFLAIYFSSTASIFTSKYANISEKVRNRFFIESMKYSNILIYNVMFLSFFIIALGCGINFTVIVPIFVGIITIITLFSFFKLGSIAFSLSDINLLLNFSYKQIYQFIKKACKKDLFNCVEFQDYYKRKVKSEIEILDTIAHYQVEINNFTNKAFDIAIDNLYLICSYQTIKNNIPNNSRWFDIKGECPYWFTADDSSKMIALNTGTGLHYKETLDEFWLEKEILSINHYIIDSNLEKTSPFSKYLSILDSIVSESICFDNINFWYEELETSWRNYTIKYIQYNYNSSLNVVVAWTGLIINLSLGISKKLNKFSIEYFNSIIEKLTTSPNQAKLILTQLVKSEELDDLINSLNIEIETEGKVLTPKWYIAEILSYVLRRNLKNINDFCDKLYNLYKSSCGDLKDSKIRNRELLAIASLSNKEIKQKFSSVYCLIFEIDLKLKEFHKDKYFKDLNYDYETQLKTKNDIHKDNIESYSGIIDLYKSGYEKSIDSPDYIGYVYNNLVYDSFNILLTNNDVNSFITHIRLLMENASIIEKELIKSLSGYQPSNYTLHLENSIRLTIMDVIGCYFYYNYLINNNDNIKLLTKFLDEFFLESDNYEKEIPKYIYSYKVYTEINCICEPNSLESINRKLAFQAFIKEKNLLKITFDDFYLGEVEHDNKFIKAFPYDNNMGFSAEFYEFFGVCYLNRFLKDDSKLKTKYDWDKKINENG